MTPTRDDLLAAFARSGHQLWLVGGAVRDELLGRPHGDLDFTTDALPDDVEAIGEAIGANLRTVGKKYGTIGVFLDPDWYEITTFRGDSYTGGTRWPDVTFGIALANHGLDLERAPHLSRRYWEENSSRMRLFDDALETLTSLREAGFRLGLITNGPASMQRWKIGQFALASYFDVMVIEGEFGHGKPSPRIFAHALAAVGLEPHEAWHVGDNLYADIAGAQAAGIHAAWIHRDRLEMGESPKAIPDRVIAHLDELRAALGV